jgi:hypothetical protein
VAATFMSRSARGRWAGLVAVVALVAVAAPALASALTSRSSSYKDPSGDAKAGPDVTGVKVAKLRNGWLQFTLTIANRKSNIQVGDVVYVALDSDRKPSTGINVTHSTDPKQQGPDYAFTMYYAGGSSLTSGGFRLAKGRQPKSIAKPSTIKETAKAGTFSIAVSPKLFRVPKRGFAFFVWSYSNPSSSGNLDFAPNAGEYSYRGR